MNRSCFCHPLPSENRTGLLEEVLGVSNACIFMSVDFISIGLIFMLVRGCMHLKHLVFSCILDHVFKTVTKALGK